MIKLTSSAIQEVARMLSQQANNEGLGLRLCVKGGGCSGLSYDMAFDRMKAGDQASVFDGVNVFVDPKSYLYLDGITFDYSDSLKDKGFKFVNPNAVKTCGCGESFSV